MSPRQTPSTPPPAAELPMLDASVHERADAARNRAAILQAARRLLESGGAEALTMDAIACEARVGKGTIFRRFGDRSSLFHALLDERERALQEAMLRGPGPLGPDAPPRERLAAFGEALLDQLAEHGDIIVVAESGEPGARLRSPVHAGRRLHVIALLRAAGVQADVEYLADVLLGALAADLVLHELRVRGRSLPELKLGWCHLVAALTPGENA